MNNCCRKAAAVRAEKYLVINDICGSTSNTNKQRMVGGKRKNNKWMIE